MITKQNLPLLTHRLIRFAVAAAATVVLALLLAILLDGSKAYSNNLPDINGMWLEQDVAPYAADSFEIRPEGVFVGGRQVNTQYQWDGSTLEYLKGGTLYSYSFLSGRFIRQRPAHYISSFSRQNIAQHQPH
ncbi:DUF2850 domain-containing protein [Photobacterium sp. ZSDE20]|uniref:DUF2850 domain-containing protein n=1 Tax=Photobacterium pectinilyticum TaxID=2906793 RepID=A0ABT1N1T6_9GAMM|nr:DUF2850 domain-containing protein [Photobacterium sp. ZSDE20]MCQ1058502.1 DUF2850 domain-containing protein [Photobacterium sp. ZSDE20]MDD1823273.1 DUF2850 domain-containing protein [Photobacterium sp. ZSDE20]